MNVDRQRQFFMLAGRLYNCLAPTPVLSLDNYVDEYNEKDDELFRR